MGRYTGKTCRLLVMIGLTSSFFLVEIITGYITNSLALVGDSYHMLSDVVALLVGFASVRISKWSSDKNTYGWARAEVLGALVNAVFLIALCFTIFVEALQRLAHDDEINNPNLMLIVGGLGLLINIIGLVLFGSHGHSHGGHGHSHGGGDHGHGHSHGDHVHTSNNSLILEVPALPSPTHEHSETAKLKDSLVHERSSEVANGEVRPPGEVMGEEADDPEETEEQKAEKKISNSAAQLNMRAVFLHVLGDALGSVVVIISALVIKYVKADWRFKVDPAMSMVLVIIILSTTIPLLRESAMILLQTVPTHIQVQDLQHKLLEKVPGVLAVHEFHIWQLAGNRIIASAHIRCQTLNDYMRIAEDVKSFFHNEGIHSTTIQPEFVETAPSGMYIHSNNCLLPCIEDSCLKHQCCTKDPYKEEENKSQRDDKEDKDQKRKHIIWKPFSNGRRRRTPSGGRNIHNSASSPVLPQMHWEFNSPKEDKGVCVPCADSANGHMEHGVHDNGSHGDPVGLEFSFMQESPSPRGVSPGEVRVCIEDATNDLEADSPGSSSAVAMVTPDVSFESAGSRVSFPPPKPPRVTPVNTLRSSTPTTGPGSMDITESTPATVDLNMDTSGSNTINENTTLVNIPDSTVDTEINPHTTDISEANNVDTTDMPTVENEDISCQNDVEGKSSNTAEPGEAEPRHELDNSSECDQLLELRGPVSSVELSPSSMGLSPSSMGLSPSSMGLNPSSVEQSQLGQAIKRLSRDLQKIRGSLGSDLHLDGSLDGEELLPLVSTEQTNEETA